MDARPSGSAAECIGVAEEARGGELRTGGQLVVDALLAHGARRLFGVPGESYLAILDALFDVREQVEMVTCRHEHGASMMAEAHGKLTGEPGVCLVTRGPGACNAAIGVHTAFQDSTPMLLLVGQVKRRFLGRGAFQEVDFACIKSELTPAEHWRRRSATLITPRSPALTARTANGWSAPSSSPRPSSGRRRPAALR